MGLKVDARHKQTTTVYKNGNSLCVRLPKSICDKVGIQGGEMVRVCEDSGKVIVEVLGESGVSGGRGR